MKKQLAIALGLAVVSVPALASKARLESLGQSANGSQVIDDHRSIFLNPAQLNNHKDFVTIEVGNAESQYTLGSVNDPDAATTPKAEGGVIKSSGNMVYGIYFGDESNISNSLRAAALTTNMKKEVMESNSTTLFVGGDAGVQWGASLMHQAYEDEAAEDEASAMRARLGAISGNIEVFANIGISNKAEVAGGGAGKEFEGTSSYDLGLTYNAGGDVQYLFRTSAIAAENEGGDEFTASTMDIGASKSYKLNDKAMMWAQVWYKTSEQEDFAGSEEKTVALPVTISLEANATDWLSLRGFINKNVLIGSTEDNDGKSTTDDGLAHGLGASLVYGDLTIDGSLILGGNTSDTNSTVGTLRLDEPMNRISVTYNF
jgi:hypothetical protein